MNGRKFFGNQNTRYGKAHEKRALWCFARGYPKSLINMNLGFCVNGKAPMFGFSGDGVMDGHTLLEVKCPIAGKKYRKCELCRRIRYLKERKDGTFELNRNHTYYTQIQLGLAVMNLTAAKFLVYYKNTTTKKKKKTTVEGVIEFNIERDDVFMYNMMFTLHIRYFSIYSTVSS